MNEQDFEYDFGLSFAGEQREYVEKVAEELRLHGIRVFFDEYEKAELWGVDLYSHFSEIYQRKCMYCILFASKQYADKVWTTHERKSAQARALVEKKEYILPARFDDTPIPGLPDTVCYIDLGQTSPSELADLARKKLGIPVRKNYLPPVMDLLFERLDIEEDDDKTQACVDSHAASFFQSLRKMTHNEKSVVLSLIRFGCHEDLPDNIHINADLLRRQTGKQIKTLKRLLAGLRSLGFQCFFEKSDETDTDEGENILGDAYMFKLTWMNLQEHEEFFPELLVVAEMVSLVSEHCCDECGRTLLENLDFSRLSSATASRDS